jgi:glycerol-3-phosphate acyltransferase PlsX
MKIAIDVMGGDNAPEVNIRGLQLAMDDFSDIESFLLVGDEAVVREELARWDIAADNARLEIVHASQVVEMTDPSAAALRKKRDSSITICAELLSGGRADAIVSAGHTGAAVAATVVKTRMLPGVDRPGIAAVFPAPKGHFVMLDVGANVDCKPVHLAQYAILGEAYSHCVLGVETPKVGLMSVGEEEGKGNELTKESAKLLKNVPVNYIGNVEGHDMFANEVDVVVCDGFVGNAVLKCCESLAKAMAGILKERLSVTPLRMAGALLSKQAFRELREMTDHEEYGGAPLLGINGVCIIAHGSSSPKSIRNAIRVAREMVKKQINERIQEKLATANLTGDE